MLKFIWLILLLVDGAAFRRPVAYVSTLYSKPVQLGVAVTPNLNTDVNEGMNAYMRTISTTECVEGFFTQFNDMPSASTPEAAAVRAMQDRGY